MKQSELVIEWVREFGDITPALMAGRIYKDTMFGSETSKRCRELRTKGVLDSRKDGKFEIFFLKEIKPAVVIKINEQPKQDGMFATQRRYY